MMDAGQSANRPAAIKATLRSKASRVPAKMAAHVRQSKTALTVEICNALASNKSDPGASPTIH